MLQILPQGDDVFHLVESGSRRVGWIRGAVIRIGAFATEQEAMSAALKGARVLDAYLRSGPNRQTAPVDIAGNDTVAEQISGPDAPGGGARPDTRLVHDGAYEWIVVARRPLARLIRPRAPRVVDVTPPVTAGPSDAIARRPAPGATAHDFALEFVIPAAVAPVTRLTLARVLHRAFAPGGARRAGNTPADRPPATPRADQPSRMSHTTRVRSTSSGVPVPAGTKMSLRDEPDPTDPSPAA
jgi:hypothetical protein